MERTILAALAAKKLDEMVDEFIREHSSRISQLSLNEAELKDLIWKVIGEAVELRQANPNRN